MGGRDPQTAVHMWHKSEQSHLSDLRHPGGTNATALSPAVVQKTVLRRRQRDRCELYIEECVYVRDVGIKNGFTCFLFSAFKKKKCLKKLLWILFMLTLSCVSR